MAPSDLLKYRKCHAGQNLTIYSIHASILSELKLGGNNHAFNRSLLERCYQCVWFFDALRIRREFPCSSRCRRTADVGWILNAQLSQSWQIPPLRFALIGHPMSVFLCLTPHDTFY